MAERPHAAPLALVALLVVTACSGEQTPVGPADSSVADRSSLPRDLGGGDLQDSDAAPPDLPWVGEVPADAFAAFRCGVGGAWIDDARLGDLVTTGDQAPVVQQASFLAALAAAAGLNAGQQPRFDVESDTLLYLTQDRGALIEASALVAYPVNAGTSELPVLLFLHGTSGFTDGCGVSGGSGAALLAAYIASLGYVVVAPDYIGLKAFGEPTGFLHPYLVGEATAIASLDSVRAARKIVRARYPQALVTAGVVTLGGSQGGHAALWVDRLAPYYARELQLLGGVATVPPVDVLAQVERALQQQVPATANTIAFYGAAASWYGVADRLDEVFLARDPSIPALLASDCKPAQGVQGETLQSVFDDQLLVAAASGSLADYDVWGCMATQNSLNRTAVVPVASARDGYGILFVVGSEDVLVHPPLQRQSFAALCAQGITLSYLECAGASHTQATSWALPEILDYLADRVEGRKPSESCQTKAAVVCGGTPQ